MKKKGSIRTSCVDSRVIIRSVGAAETEQDGKGKTEQERQTELGKHVSKWSRERNVSIIEMECGRMKEAKALSQ